MGNTRPWHVMSAFSIMKTAKNSFGRLSEALHEQRSWSCGSGVADLQYSSSGVAGSGFAILKKKTRGR